MKNVGMNMRFFLFLMFLLSAAFISCSDCSAATVGEVEVSGLSSMGRDELLYLLDIQPGEKIAEDSVQAGIKRAFLKGIFEDISVEAKEGENTKVVVRVKEKDVVRKISVGGSYAVSGKKIRESLGIKEGQYVTCQLIDSSVASLRHELALMGFPHAEIKAEINKLKAPYRVDLRITVDTGLPEKIKKIEIEGEAKEAKSLMKLSEGDVYNQVILKRDIEKIKARLKKEGHYKPVISPYVYKDGILSFSVDPGKSLKITLQGNESVSGGDLMKEMPFFEDEDFSEDVVQEAVNRLLSVYHTKGYPYAQVAPVVTTKEDLITVAFFVFEGERMKVGKISFHGISLNGDRLKEIMSLKEGKLFNPDALDGDRENLENFYNALGYLTAKIEDIQTVREEEADRVDIVVTVKEGPKTEIASVKITGTNLVSETEVQKAVNLHPGDPYNEVDISDARYRVIELYSNRGFPDVAVEVKREAEDHKAALTFEIHEGAVVLFGKTIVTGNQITKYKVIRRELLQQEDIPFNYGLLSQERQKLYKLGLFTDIDMEVLDRYKDKRDVLVKLREGNAGAVELSLGYAEYERYRGILDISYRNVMGLDRQISLRLELSSLEKRYILQYYEPWFLSKELPFRVFVLGEDKKEISIDTRETRYRLTRNTITAGFEKKMSDRFKGELYYEFSLVNTFDVKPDVILTKEDTGTLVISGLRFGIIYDARDNQFYPTKGFFSGATVKLTSPIFLSETDFLK
ncbi:MAG TPA: POTRA domain-containing protein, partial [Thermodesulfovibrionales bacterium]|nr:POTRA domain-containing protein [Thermodesulfovibrionales bacterium]